MVQILVHMQTALSFLNDNLHVRFLKRNSLFTGMEMGISSHVQVFRSVWTSF